MKAVRSIVLLTVFTFLSAPIGMAQEKSTEQLGKVRLSHILRSQGSGPVRARRGDAALLLVH